MINRSKIREILTKEVTMKKLALLAAFAVTACSNQVLELKPQSSTEPSYDRFQHFFVGGLGQTQTEKASICGEGKITKVETETTFLNGLLSSVSYGIYNPRQIRIYCN